MGGASKNVDTRIFRSEGVSSDEKHRNPCTLNKGGRQLDESVKFSLLVTNQ
jgi:hypothetical protein